MPKPPEGWSTGEKERKSGRASWRQKHESTSSQAMSPDLFSPPPCTARGRFLFQPDQDHSGLTTALPAPLPPPLLASEGSLETQTYKLDHVWHVSRPCTSWVWSRTPRSQPSGGRDGTTEVQSQLRPHRTLYKEQKQNSGYRDGSVLKTTCCSCRGPTFCPQYRIKWVIPACNYSFRDLPPPGLHRHPHLGGIHAFPKAQTPT